MFMDTIHERLTDAVVRIDEYLQRGTRFLFPVEPAPPSLATAETFPDLDSVLFEVKIYHGVLF